MSIPAPVVLCVADACALFPIPAVCSDGYMGTEENIMAIIFARFPELFADYDNNQWGDHGDNCAIFNHQSRLRKERQARGE